MLYSSLLIATVGICAWIALDLMVGSTWRRRIGSLAVLATTASLWAGGELLVSIASAPSEMLFARRVLFLGVCLLGPVWFWSAVEASSPGWSRRRRGVLAAILLPVIVLYSTLFWDTSGLFVDGTSPTPRHGPLFPYHVAYSWGLILAGLGALLWSIRARAIPSSRMQIALLCSAVVAPLIGNIMWVTDTFVGEDPTPILFGLSALVLRYVVLDIIWGAHHLPFARHEVVEQMETGFLVADQRGRIIDSNPAAETLLHERELEGRVLGDVLREIDLHHALDLEAKEFPLRRGHQRVGTGLAIHDRSERRRLDHRIETTTRVEALAHLASGIAHEVNNPLAYLTANLALIEPLVSHLPLCAECSRLPKSIRELAAEAPALLADSREGAERIRRIIAQLGRMISRATDEEPLSEPHSFDLEDAIERATEFVTFSHEDAHVTVTSSGEFIAFASELDVIHILIHLLMNAIREVGSDGTIEVRVSSVPHGRVVEVVDDGPGIPESELPYLFDPLFTKGRPGRLGLGLSHCWRLARQNEAHIEARNRAAGGAAFKLTLPAGKDDRSHLRT